MWSIRTEDYCVENLGPASIVRTLPANTVLAMGLGGIDIGTFSEPPTSTGGWGAIIDVQGDAILAFIPVRCRDALRRLLASGDAGSAAARFQKSDTKASLDPHVPERPDGHPVRRRVRAQDDRRKNPIEPWVYRRRSSRRRAARHIRHGNVCRQRHPRRL